MTTTTPALFMSEVIKSFRLRLWDKGFVELPTALIHDHDACQVFNRVQLVDGRFIKDSGGLALRTNLAYGPKIFEVTQCARRDQVDERHLQQFTMLDLYSANVTLEDAISLCAELIQPFYRGVTRRFSVADHIRLELGVDLVSDPAANDELRGVLSARYHRPAAALSQLIDSYIADEVAPLSRGCCLIATDFPTGAEATGRKKEGTVAVSCIGEFQIDGLEVVQLIEDESDTRAYRNRAIELGHYGPEVETVCDLIDDGSVPPTSAGFGIGIERLCMVCLGAETISSFLATPQFTREGKVLAGGPATIFNSVDGSGKLPAPDERV